MCAIIILYTARLVSLIFFTLTLYAHFIGHIDDIGVMYRMLFIIIYFFLLSQFVNENTVFNLVFYVRVGRNSCIRQQS